MLLATCQPALPLAGDLMFKEKADGEGFEQPPVSQGKSPVSSSAAHKAAQLKLDQNGTPIDPRIGTILNAWPGLSEATRALMFDLYQRSIVSPTITDESASQKQSV